MFLNPDTAGFPSATEQNKAFNAFKKDLITDQKERNVSIKLIHSEGLTKLMGSTKLMPEEANRHESFIRRWHELS